jgi:hypothetical protein
VRQVKWKPGPEADTAGEVLVSLTDFTADRRLDLPRVWRDGYRLRRAWPTLDGAVGLWLWTLPSQRRSGSISVWTSEEALNAFVRWPVHVAIMRHYRERGSMQPDSWWSERFDLEAVWDEAERRLRARG